MDIYKIKEKVTKEADKIIVHFKYQMKLRKALKISDSQSIFDNSENPKIAIHFHVFYTELIEEIYNYVAHINKNFTLFITVVNDEDLKFVQHFFENKTYKFKLNIIKVENKGRDIYPFYLALHNCYSEYDYIAHFHTKKSLHTDFGEVWRKYLCDNILGSNYLFDNIIGYFENNRTAGFLVPPAVPNEQVVNAYYAFKDNKVSYKDKIEIALSKFGIPLDELYAHKKNKDFPCGNMFIARIDAIKQFFSTELKDDDFPKEAGQLTDTLQHYVELMWKYIVDYNGYEYLEVLRK